MKAAYFILVFALALQGCSTSTRQTFSNVHGDFKIDWSEKNVRRIEYRGEEVPNGHLVISIIRSKNRKEVRINKRNDKVWAEETTTPAAIRAISEGVTYHSEYSHVNSELVEVQEWKLEASGALIYKEIRVESANGSMDRKEFFGPFDTPLKPQ